MFTRGLAVALVLAGCSWTFQERPPSRLEAGQACSESKALPAIDTILFGLNAFGAVGVATIGVDSDRIDALPGLSIAAGATVAAVIYALSANSGFKWSEECRRRGSSGRVSK